MRLAKVPGSGVQHRNRRGSDICHLRGGRLIMPVGSSQFAARQERPNASSCGAASDFIGHGGVAPAPATNGASPHSGKTDREKFPTGSTEVLFDSNEWPHH